MHRTHGPIACNPTCGGQTHDKIPIGGHNVCPTHHIDHSSDKSIKWLGSMERNRMHTKQGDPAKPEGFISPMSRNATRWRYDRTLGQTANHRDYRYVTLALRNVP